MQVKSQGVGFPAAPSLPPPHSGPSEEAFSSDTIVGDSPFPFCFPVEQCLRRVDPTRQPHPAIYFIPTVSVLHNPGGLTLSSLTTTGQDPSVGQR